MYISKKYHIEKAKKYSFLNAFTLLEIIMAMLILSLVVAGIFGLFVTSRQFLNEAGHRLQAANYAKIVAETLKVYVSADANTPVNAGLAFTDDSFSSIGLSQNMLIGGFRYNCNYTVSNAIIDGNINTNIKDVAINVTWTEQ